MGGRFKARGAPTSPLHDGAHYDAAHAYLTQDLGFWTGVAQTYGGPLLELACGTGRVAIPLAESGIEVTGIDNHVSMLSRARAKSADTGPAIRWVQGDMREFDLGTRFATVILPFNALCLVHSSDDAQRMLHCVRNHLEPGARFILDVVNPRLERLADTSDTERSFATYEFPGHDEGQVRATHRSSYDRATQIMHVDITYHFPGDAIAYDQLGMRMYFPQELRALLGYAGFDVVRAFGDYDESPLVSESPRQLLVCSPAT